MSHLRLLIVTYFLISIVASNTVNAKIIHNDTTLTVAGITLSGNKITKDRIIYRELEFKVGDSYPAQKLDSLLVKSQQNLMNRSLFNFVTITKSIEGQNVNVNISVIERWYIWPIPIFQFADRNINAWWEKRDFGRVNYGINLRVDNFRGLMEKLNITLQLGYDVVVAAKWTVPYLTKNQVVGMDVDVGVKLNRTIAFETIDNKEVFYNSNIGYSSQQIYSNISITFRPGYNYLHIAQLGFNQHNFQDTILTLNPNYAKHQGPYNFFSLNYAFKLDFRDYKAYPLEGYYFDVSVGKLGFGIFNNGINRISLNANFDQYLKLYNKFYFAYSVGGQLSNQKPQLPYFIKSGLGYFPNNIRGYELYVVDGQQVAMFKTNLKYELLPKTVFKIDWIKSPKFSEVFTAFYANIFFDLAYVSDVNTYELNPLANQLIYGTGFGIDMVTYYDLVLRLELTYNKQRETGFFINFVAPI